MRRIRVALALTSLAVLVPMAVLAWRALDGLATQRAAHHQAVAERAFDEMERALSSFLEREEARPFEHYRFYLESSGERSPLAAPAAEDFVVGPFQIDPDGSVHSPLEPREPETARARGDWPLAPEVARSVAELRRAVETAWSPRRHSELETAAAGQAAAPLTPGATRELGGRLGAKDELAAKRMAANSRDDDATAYDVLQRLNLGSDSRAERKQRVTLAPAKELAKAGPSRSSGLVAAGAAAESGLASADRYRAAAPAPQARVFEGETDVLEESLAAAPAEPAAPPLADAKLDDEARAVRIALDPMVGRAAGEGYLLLARTVLVGEQGYRQGLVLDRARLGHWLERQVLDRSGLGSAARLHFVEGGSGPPGDADYVFQHRFAEPFDALTAEMQLAALPGVGSPGAIYGLVALVLVVVTAGLVALHQRVAVVLEFAQRRSNFVSAVTHELKTPLTAIRMYAEMLRDGLVSSEAKRGEYYRTITDESERLSRLIDNVLEFSRLERGTREMDFRVGPVGPVVEEAAETLRAHAEGEGYRLAVEVDEGLPPVRYDRDALLQVLFNLVDNAMKYARNAATKTVVLEVRAHEGGVAVSVRDFGPGVPSRQLGRLFEPFYRGEDEMTRVTKGTGIGLALVKDLAERMGAAADGTNASDGGFRVRVVFRPA